MEFNLRKARKLEAKIASVINAKKNDLGTSSSIRVNTDVTNIPALVLGARTTFYDNFNLVNNLITVRQEIRNEIAKANFNVGIDDLISKKVLLESQLGILNTFTSIEVFNQEEVEDTLSIYKKQLEVGSRYSVSTSAGVNFLSQIDKDKIRTDKQSLQKDIEALEDKLAELNYSSKIRLSSTTTKLLQDNGLI